jgi:hypothetical protein
MPWRDPQWFAEAVQVESLSCRPCDQRTCVHSDFRCLARITPGQVAGAAERAMRSRRPSRENDVRTVMQK